MTRYNQDFEERFVYKDLLSALIDKENAEEALTFYRQPHQYNIELLIGDGEYIIAIRYYAEEDKKNFKDTGR